MLNTLIASADANDIRHPDINVHGLAADGVDAWAAVFERADARPGAILLPRGLYRVERNLVLRSRLIPLEGAEVIPDNGVSVTTLADVESLSGSWMNTSRGGTFIGRERNAASVDQSLGKIRSPFGPHPRIKVLTDGFAHQGLNAVFLNRHDGTNQQLIYREGAGHAVDTGAVIRRVKVYGDAISPNPADIATIYDEAGIDARNMVGMQMPDGHVLGLIVIAQRSSDSDSHTAPVMLYTFPGVSEGNVWGTAIIAGVPENGWCQGHGAAILPWPASAGGHDANGIMVFGYRMADGVLSNAIVLLRKTSWGSLTALWTYRVAIEGPADKVVTEPQVVRLGNSDRWMMFVRVQGGTQNILCSTSTDMNNWSAWVDTGLPNGGNPISAIYRDGRVWIHGCQRTGAPQIPLGAPATVIETYADAETLWESAGAGGWSGWRPLCRAPHRLIGDINYCDFNGDLVGVLCVAESGDTFRAKVGILSSIYTADSEPVKMLSGSTAWDPGSLLNGAMTSTTVTVVGAVVGDFVDVTFSSLTAAGWLISGIVTAAATVTVTLTNATGATVDLPSGTLRALVRRI